MDPLHRAARAKALLQDDVLQDALRMVKDDLVGVFTYPNSSQEEVLEAHRMVRSLGALEDKLKSFVDNGAVLERRKK